MSWGEVKKINSDMTEPLNYLLWIQDLATFGSNGYVYHSPTKMAELAEKSYNAVSHSVCLGYLVVDYAGSAFELLTGDETGAFDGLTTITEVIADSDAMAVITASSVAMTAIVANDSIMDYLATSAVAKAAFVASSVAMTALAANAKAINYVVKSNAFKTAIVANATAFNAVAASMVATLDAATEYFTKTASNGDSSTTPTIGTSTSLVYVKVLHDGMATSGYNWLTAKHKHDGTTEIAHAAFPTGTGTGNVTPLVFAIGGFSGTTGTSNVGISWTTDLYEAI